MEWLPALVAALVSLAAAAFSWFAAWASRRAYREFVAEAADGTRATITIPPDSSSEDIRRSIVDAFEFEDEVQRILEVLRFKPSRGKNVDFIVDAGGSRIGIEVKTNLDHLRTQSVLRYFDEQPKLQKVLIVTKPFPEKLPDRPIRRLIHDGLLTLIAAEDEQSLAYRIRQELRPPHEPQPGRYSVKQN